MKLILKYCTALILLLNFWLVEGKNADVLNLPNSDIATIDNYNPEKENPTEIPTGLPEEKRKTEEKIENSTESIEKDTSVEFYHFICCLFFLEKQESKKNTSFYSNTEGFSLLHSRFIHIWVCCFLN